MRVAQAAVRGAGVALLKYKRYHEMNGVVLTHHNSHTSSDRSQNRRRPRTTPFDRGLCHPMPLI